MIILFLDFISLQNAEALIMIRFPLLIFGKMKIVKLYMRHFGSVLKVIL